MALKNEELNRLHDDELADAKSIDRESLEQVDRERLAAIDEVGALVRNTLLARADSDGVDVWAQVAARLPARRPKVVEPASTLQRFRRWLTDYRLLVPAMAATAALLVWLGTSRVTITNGCDIEELEISGAVATVLHMDDDGPGTSTVIWMTEDEK